MKLVYIVGPYKADTEYEVQMNINQAEAMAAAVWKIGHIAVCPHKNSAHFGGLCEDSLFIKGYLELLRKCDIVLTSYGWEASEGAKKEVKLAVQLGIPVVHSIRELKDLTERNAN